MKTLKTLGLLLFMAMGVLAQPTPDDLFISGYVTDQSGGAQANHEVCVSFVSNNPALPSDTICTNTNANGYYSIIVVNGSLTGPNVSFDVSTLDSCAQVPLVQTIDNQQGTVDSADVDFVICSSGGCDAAFTTAGSTPTGTYTFTADNQIGDWDYLWTVNNQEVSSVSIFQTSLQTGINEVCLTVTDSLNNCTDTQCETIINGCDAFITASYDSVTGTALTANSVGVGPFTYAWSNAETTQSITNLQPGGYCVTITDATGCQVTVCDTVGCTGSVSPDLQITTTVDSAGGGLVYILSANSGYSIYSWSTGSNSPSTTVQNPSPNGEEVCVTVEDAFGCTETACDTLYPISSCFAEIQASTDSIGNVVLTAISTGTGPFTYLWDNNQITQSISINQPFPHCVTITDANGCSATACDSTGCLGFEPDVQIVSTIDSTGGGVAYFLDGGAGYTDYDWSDGSTAQTAGPFQPGPNGEVICLTVTNQYGCSTTKCDTLFPINGGCDVEILYSHPPSGAYLTANALGTAPFQYEWNTGDTSETVFVPSFPGVYCVQVTDATGCQTGWVCDTVDCSLGVTPTPQITRVWQTVAGSIRLYVTTGNVFEEYAWFDGGTSYETVIQNPNPSGEIVCVTVTDDYGCVESVCDTIELPEYNCPPIDITTTVDTAGGGLEYSLEASGGFQSYEWWPTDDTSQAIVVQNVNPNGEEYCVIGGGPSGCYSYSCDTLFPYFNGGCVADLWYEANVDSNLIVIDTLEVLYAGTQSSSNSYFWTMEAGGQVWTANTQDLQLSLPPTLVPTAGIDVEVCVTVTDSLTNCVDSYCEIITLVPDSNIICDGIITTTQDSTGLYYTLSATGFGVGPFSFDWSNGDTSQEITIAQSGVYCVDITNASGCVYTVCDTIGESSGCDASFTSSGFTPSGYTFTADVQDSTLSYQWLLDGTVFSGGYEANLQNLANGVYTVCLTVNDSVNNCFDTQCFTFASGCDASFATAGSIPAGDYTFSADNQYIGWDYSWAVNNQTVSSVSILQTSLPTGINEVCLTVTDSLNNCTDTQCETIISGCDAAFTSSGPDSLGQYSFNADIQNPAWDYLWTSNNQPISSVSIMQTSLPNGVNEVCLTVVDSVSNCSDTQCQTITAGQCNASFTNFGVDSITGEYTFSADVQSPDWNYLWTANNLVVSSVSIFETPLSMGANEICLTVTDSVNNCSETECQTITVNNNSCYGYISGEIYAGTNNQPLNNGVVYLITYDTATNMLDAVHTIDLGPGNIYQFGPLPCGDYMIKAAADNNSPYYSDHVPTYHGNSPFWSFAQTLSLSQVNTQITADVVLIAANNPGGPGFIGGDVTQGANKVDPGDPLEGMQVMLFNLSGDAIAYTYTDGNGEFGFSNLAYGTYQVYVEVLGIPTIPAYVTIGPDNPSEDDIHIYATYELITTGIEEFDFDGAISEVYPNPVGDDAWVNFNLESGVQVDIHILDLTGRTISTTSHSISSGGDQVRFDVDGLTEGYYFLNIQEEEGAFGVTRKFLRVD